MSGILFSLILIAGIARAQDANIAYPVAELGNCSSKSECKTFCDAPANIEACISFAEKNNLMPPEEIQMAKKFIAAGAKGPGGCTGKDSCEAYCNDILHIDACVSFAEQSGMMSESELREAKLVQAAIQKGVTPPPCGGKQACDAYCQQPEHMPACISFAKEAGLMSAEEAQNADKMLQAIQNGAKPPACRGKAECDAYCGQEEHFSECLEFGKAAGFMTDAEYEMAKKTGGKGPGGCKGKEECDAFCTSSPENEELCINFQAEKGLISEEQKNQMEGDRQRMRESFTNMPEEVAQCIRERIGADTFEKLKSGQQRVTRTIGEAMPACFKQFEGQREAQENERRQMMGPQPQGEGFSQGQYQGPPPGGAPGPYPCEGEQCGPPPTGSYPPPNGSMPPPGGSYPPPCDGENCQPPAQMLAPTGTVAPLPQTQPTGTEAPPASEPSTATEPAPAQSPEPAPSVSTDSLGAAVILFLEPLRLTW